MRPPRSTAFSNQRTYATSLMRKRDIDLITRLEQEDNRSAFIRRCIRYYIEHEQDILNQEREEALCKKLEAL